MRKTPNRAQFTSIKEMAEAFDYFLFDCDGVLWHGEEQHIGNAFRNIEYLESLGKQVYFVTNNSSISRAQMQKKMASDVFGYAGAKIDHLYPSGTVAAQYLVQKMPEIKKVRVVGMESLTEELNAVGIQTIGGQEPDPAYTEQDWFTYEKISSYEFDEEVGAVVSGIDYRINYSKIALASIYIQRCKRWIVTNEDQYTMQSGYRAPGNACCISAIESSLRKPGSSSLICEKIVTGKPNPDIVNLIRRQHNIPESHLSKMVMIGDRPDTDIALGNNAGIATCLVLTGVVQNQEQLIQFCRQSDSHKPGFVLHSFGQDPDFVNGEHSASIDLE